MASNWFPMLRNGAQFVNIGCPKPYIDVAMPCIDQTMQTSAYSVLVIRVPRRLIQAGSHPRPTGSTSLHTGAEPEHPRRRLPTSRGKL